jgi:hypothetical protein
MPGHEHYKLGPAVGAVLLDNVAGVAAELVLPPL